MPIPSTTYVPASILREKLTNIPSSYMQAVNALDGRIFNGNAIVPKFFDEEKFEQGVYE